MRERCLTKIEVNLPIGIKTTKVLAKIKDLFLDTKGIGGCTYSLPSKPPIFKGMWINPETSIPVEDDIILIYGCYDIDNARVELEKLLAHIKELIETEGEEEAAWITYSSVCALTF